MIEEIIIGIIVAGAVYYLYRRFKATASAGGTSCGCGCENCVTARIGCGINGTKQASERYLGIEGRPGVPHGLDRRNGVYL